MKSRWIRPIRRKDQRMSKEEIINAIYTGNLVDVTEQEYREWARSAIQEQAGKWMDQGDTVRGMIALQEVVRLDAVFSFVIG